MNQVNYQTRDQINQITYQCFTMADQDRSNFLTINEFYNFLILVYQKLNLNRNLSQQEC